MRREAPQGCGGHPERLVSRFVVFRMSKNNEEGEGARLVCL